MHNSRNSTGIRPSGPIRIWLVCALAAGISGCIPYRARPIDPDARAVEFRTRTLGDEHVRAFVARHAPAGREHAQAEVWGLTDLTLAAFYFSPDLGLERARLESARTARITAGQRPNPSVSASPGLNSTTDVPTPWILTSVLDVTIETGGKRRARLEESEWNTEAAARRVAEKAWQVRSSVRQALANVFTSRERKRLLDEQVRTRARIVEGMDQRYRYGAVSAYELSQARMSSQQTRLELREAERQEVLAVIELAGAVGVPREALDGIALAFDELDVPLPDSSLSGARETALFNRADLLGVLAEYAASEAALKGEIAKQYPDLQLGPGYEYDQGDDKWSLGIGFSLPIFNRNRGGIREAEARRAEVGARFNLLQQEVIASVDAAVAGYRSAAKKLEEAETLVAEARDRQRQAEDRFAAGDISEAELAAQKLELSTAMLNQLDVASEVRQELGRVENALQSPLGISNSAWLESSTGGESRDETK